MFFYLLLFSVKSLVVARREESLRLYHLQVLDIVCRIELLVDHPILEDLSLHQVQIVVWLAICHCDVSQLENRE